MKKVKATLTTHSNDEWHHTESDAYTFQVDGWTFIAHRNLTKSLRQEKRWTVSDYLTGRRIRPFTYPTRRDAVEDSTEAILKVASQSGRTVSREMALMTNDLDHVNL